MDLKLVVFDVDGTLVDSQGDIMAAMTTAFAAVGLAAPDRRRVLGIVGLSLPQAMAALVPEHPEVHRDLVEAYKSAYMQLRSENGTARSSPLYPGVRDVLDILSRRDDILLGVATGKSRRGLDKLIEGHGLQGVFVTRQVADDHPSKPHPSMLLTALAETGVDPARAVMVGDTTFDMDMARAAGVRALGVSWGYHPANRLTAAQRVLDDISELETELDRLWGMA